MENTLSPARITRWFVAISAVFLCNGLGIATWASRVPALKIALGIDNIQLGVALFAAGLGAIVGMSTGPLLLARLRSHRGIVLSLTIAALGIAVIGLSGQIVVSYPLLVAGLTLFGYGNGAVDIIMNVEGAAIENATGRTRLPMLHGMFALGTVLGAGVGALAAQQDVQVFAHLLAIALLLVVVALLAAPAIPRHPVPEAPREKAPLRERLASQLRVWKEPRTYGLGAVMLGMAFAEGAANDWLPLAMVEEHGANQSLGAAGLAVFSLSMTAMRFLAGPLVDRIGRVAMLRILAASAVIGMAVFILAPTLPLVLLGAALWGLGVSLGFPLGMSAAADDPAQAAARVSAAATIGYIAFLCGPPLLGILSERWGILPTLSLIILLAVASGLASGAAKPLAAPEAAEAK